jgi:hypothetical protein
MLWFTWQESPHVVALRLSEYVAPRLGPCVLLQWRVKQQAGLAIQAGPRQTLKALVGYSGLTSGAIKPGTAAVRGPGDVLSTVSHVPFRENIPA